MPALTVLLTCVPGLMCSGLFHLKFEYDTSSSLMTRIRRSLRFVGSVKGRFSVEITAAEGLGRFEEIQLY